MIEHIIHKNPAVAGGIIKGWFVCTKPFAFKGKTMCQYGRTKKEALSNFKKYLKEQNGN